MKLSILGSCVSRDVISFADVGAISLDVYIARSSLASMFARPPFEDGFSMKLTSAFQRRVVAFDLTKAAERLIEEADSDVILIDLIDERFDLLEMPEGGRCTLSTELLSTGVQKVMAGKRIRSGISPYMARWREGWETLVSILNRHDALSRLLINKVYWQLKCDNGTSFDAAQVEAANQTLKLMYGTMKKSLAPEQFIDYEGKLSCPSTHKWGASPFHFSDENMQFALERLYKFHASRS